MENAVVVHSGGIENFVLYLETSIMCCDLENPTSGAVNVSGRNPEDTATYVCISGFELVGADTLTCGSDGMWSPDPPVCGCEFYHK